MGFSEPSSIADIKAFSLLETYKSDVVIGKRSNEQIALAYLYKLIAELETRVTALE